MQSLDLGRAFKTPFQDKNWITKTLLGWVWFILFVTSPAVYGAEIEYIQSVANGREELPEWSDFGGKWVKGFMVALAGFLFALPLVILGLIMVLPAVIASSGNGGNSNAASALASGGICLFWLIAFIYMIALTFYFYAATVHYAMTGRFGAFFSFGEVFALMRKGGYFMAWLYAFIITLVVGAVMGLASSITFGILGILYPAVIYLELMMVAHIFGQWARGVYGIAPAMPAAPYAPASGSPYAAPTPPAYAPPAAPGYQQPPAQPPAYTPPAYTPPAAQPAPPAQQPAYTPPAYTPPATQPAPPAQQPAYTPPPAPPSAPAYEAPPAPPSAPAATPPAYAPPAAPAAPTYETPSAPPAATPDEPAPPAAPTEPPA